MTDRPLPDSWTRDPIDPADLFPPYDDPGSVKVRPTPTPPKTDDGARLGRPWEREAREDLERALAAARAMRDDAEAFIGWLTRLSPSTAADYDDLLDEATARIVRLERMAEYL